MTVQSSTDYGRFAPMHFHSRQRNVYTFPGEQKCGRFAPGSANFPGAFMHWSERTKYRERVGLSNNN